MKFGNKVCPNCNGKLDLNNGMFECSFCGCSFAADFDAEDVERIRKETETERNAAKALRENELNRTREDLKYNRYSSPAQPSQNPQPAQYTQQTNNQGNTRRRSKARIIVPIVVGSYILLQFIMVFARSCMAQHSTKTIENIFSGLDQNTKTTTVVTTTTTTSEETEETFYDYSSVASGISSDEEFMEKIDESAKSLIEADRMQLKYGTTSENELIAGYLFFSQYKNDLYLVYETKCTDDSTKYICIYYTDLLVNDDGSVYSDFTAHFDDVYDTAEDAGEKVIDKNSDRIMRELEIN